MGVSRGRREPFPDCRHKGFGKFCHRCQQAKAMQEKAAKLDSKKDASEILELQAKATKLLASTEKKVAVVSNG